MYVNIYILFLLLNFLFLKGLRHWPRYKLYEDTCYETVFALQAIPREYGTCINKLTGTLNKRCFCKFLSDFFDPIFIFL